MRDAHTPIRRRMSREKKNACQSSMQRMKKQVKKEEEVPKFSSSCHKPVDSLTFLVELIYSMARVIIRSWLQIF